MKAYAITSGDAIKCTRVALLLASQGMRSTVELGVVQLRRVRMESRS